MSGLYKKLDATVSEMNSDSIDREFLSVLEKISNELSGIREELQKVVESLDLEDRLDD